MKTALVTGCSYGIGEAVTRHFIANGYKVYGVSRTKPDINSSNFIWVEADLTVSDSIAKISSAITEDAIDIFISNAGSIIIEQASEVSEKAYHQTFSVNLLAPMLIVSELKPRLEQSVILSISSLSDRIPEADVALYCASKAANTSYFNALSKEMTDAKIIVISPDYVDTPMLHSTMDKDKTFDWSKTIPAEELVKLCTGIIDGNLQIDSGSNILVVTTALKEDLNDIESLYALITDGEGLIKLK